MRWWGFWFPDMWCLWGSALSYAVYVSNTHFLTLPNVTIVTNVTIALVDVVVCGPCSPKWLLFAWTTVAIVTIVTIMTVALVEVVVYVQRPSTPRASSPSSRSSLRSRSS